jgi:hypothetical protein
MFPLARAAAGLVGHPRAEAHPGNRKIVSDDFQFGIDEK